MRHVATVLTFGSCGWIWDTTTASRVDGSAHKMVWSTMGRSKPEYDEEEGWVSWHTRTLWEALGKLGCTFAQWLLREGATKWEEWLQRHEHTCIRRLIGWHRAAHCALEAARVQHAGPRMGNCRRERVGRPPVEMGGPGPGATLDPCRAEHPVSALRAALGAAPRGVPPHP